MTLVDKLMLAYQLGFSVLWACAALLIMLAVLWALASIWRWIRGRL